MARLSTSLLLFLGAIGGQFVSALQVSPNSPCADVCRDSMDLDRSDPNSSTTSGNDIVCQNQEYLTTIKGKKFKTCMECLQDSTFSQGSESDQMWFLYNIRYAFDHCIFGFPNATDVNIGPCSTSAACGAFKDGLTVTLDPTKATPYGYCSNEMEGEYYDKCLECSRADSSSNYLANYLIALDAGCTQKPATGQLLGLNDTIYSPFQITTIDPNNIGDDSDESESDQPQASPPMIIGIIVGVLVLLAFIAAFLFIRHHKRRARMPQNFNNARGDPNGGNGSNGNDHPGHGHRPVSSLSFRCQTHLSPMASPTAMFTSPGGASAVSPVDGNPFPYPTQSQNPSPYLDGSEKTPISPVGVNAWTQAYAERDSHQMHDLQKPAPVHKASFSEHTDDEPSILGTPTPVSAISTKSTQQLLPALKPYNPAEYGVPKAGSYGSYGGSYTTGQSPVSMAGTSPSLGGWSPVETRNGATVWETSLGQQQQQHKQQKTGGQTPQIPQIPQLSQQQLQQLQAQQLQYQHQQQQQQKKQGGGRGRGSGLGIYQKKSQMSMGSPVESVELKMNFSGPPGQP